MIVKFLDIKKINNQYAQELYKASVDLIDSGWYINGESVTQFESELSKYIGVKHTIGVANGLDALRIILTGYLTLGKLKKGDEILVPANTYIASVLAITSVGLVPVLVEADDKTFNVTAESYNCKITQNTKAILCVHLYGQQSFSDELILLSKENNLLIIEDNAQSIGARFQNKKTGNLGNAAGFSFYPGKNLGALGDGGAITTNDDEFAKVVRAISNYGSDTKYHNTYQGFNSRLDEIQAKFLSIKLPYLDEENNKRKKIASLYLSEIKNIKITLPSNPLNSEEHVWHLFVIKCQNRDYLKDYLSSNGIETLIHYPIPPHKQKCYSEYEHLSLEKTEHQHKTVLSLPISPVMTIEEVHYVIKTINNF